MRIVSTYLLILMALVAGCTSTGTKEAAVADSAVIEAITPAVLAEEWAVGWWMPRHREKLERIAEGDVDLLMIGDSITHGWEGAGKDVWARYYGHRNAVDLGYSGDRTENVLWRIEHGEVDGIEPKLAVIMIGTNNTGERMDPAKYTALGIKHIISELQTRLPETKILLLAIFPRGAGPDDEMRKRNNEVNGIISGYADNKRVFFLNINERFLDEQRVLPRDIMPDLLHPNPKGYRIWAEAIEPMVAELLGDEPVQTE